MTTVVTIMSDEYVPPQHRDWDPPPVEPRPRPIRAVRRRRSVGADQHCRTPISVNLDVLTDLVSDNPTAIAMLPDLVTEMQLT